MLNLFFALVDALLEFHCKHTGSLLFFPAEFFTLAGPKGGLHVDIALARKFSLRFTVGFLSSCRSQTADRRGMQ